jgi:Tfp pilus assembly protein PilF
MNYLQGIQRRKGIYWCYRHLGEVNATVYNTLNQEYDRLVEIKGFDELMLALNSAFDYPMLVDREDLVNSRSVQIALAKAQRYKEQLDMFAEDEAKKGGDSAGNATTREALLKLFGMDETNATDWWQIQFWINEESELERKQQLYENGLKLLPDNAELTGNYAGFLHDIRKDYEQAEVYYHKALELDANNATHNGNYASFLHIIRKDYEQAEVYYRKALELDANNAANNGNYASFLHIIRKDYEQAEVYYRKALELDANNATNNGNYASFLHIIRKDYEQAEVYYRKVLDIDANNANNNVNYANFLKNIRRNYKKAEFHYHKALEFGANNASVNGDYALFLHEIGKDYEQAEIFYKKALELDINNATINSNYASFLVHVLKDHKQADVYYCKALDLDVNNVNNNGNYAGFLLMQGKTAQALPYLEKALQSDQPALLLECWFYRLAHFPEEREEARQQIEALLQQGIRSPGWDFSDNIRRAEQDGYPDVAALTALAARISEV